MISYDHKLPLEIIKMIIEYDKELNKFNKY